MNLSDIMDVNVEAERVHIANKKWWVDIHTGEPIQRDKGDLLMLIVTELAETMEGARKNLMDDHLPQYPMEHVEIIDAFIRTLDYRFGSGYRHEFEYQEYVPVTKTYTVGNRLMELVSTIVCLWERQYVLSWKQIMDHLINTYYWYACYRGFAEQFREIYEAKMAYNATRVDHSIEHRLSEHGKKI